MALATAAGIRRGRRCKLTATGDATAASPEAVVVGAGPAGLAAALMLSQRGWKVKVLEKTPDPASYDPGKGFMYLIDGRGQKCLQELNPELFAKLVESFVGMADAKIGVLTPKGLTESVNPIKDSSRKSYWIPRHAFVGLLLEEAKKRENISLSVEVEIDDIVFDGQFHVKATSSDAPLEGLAGKTIRKIKKKVPRSCDTLKDAQPLQDVAADWCAPGIYQAWAVPCQAFNMAYVLGMVVIMCYILDVMLILTSFFLLYYYVSSESHKPIYRYWAAVLHALGTGLFATACVTYTIFGMGRLNSIGGSGIRGLFEAATSVGMTPGYFAVWFGIFCQLAALGLHSAMQVRGEESEDQKFYKEMLKEQQQYGAVEDQMQGQSVSTAPRFSGHVMSLAQTEPGPTSPLPSSVLAVGQATAPMPSLPSPSTEGPEQPVPGTPAW